MRDCTENDSVIGMPDESVNQRVHTFGEYMIIMLWTIVRVTLFRFSPTQCYFWRRWLLRAFGAKLAAKVAIRPDAQIEYPWKLKMGRYSCLGKRVMMYNLDFVEIGEFVTISQGVHICCGSHDYTRKDFALITRPVTIEKGAWLAAECFVGPGVSIGEYAVVAARAVVVKDIPAGMVCGGNPCTVIKKRMENI